MYVNPKLTAKATAIASTYNGNWLFKNNNIPGNTVTDIPVAFNWNKAAKKPPVAPPINPITNGLPKRKLTPKIAGSVIPNAAEKADGNAQAFNFVSVVLKATANVAPTCAAIAAEIIGLNGFNSTPVAIFEDCNNCVSKKLKMW